MKSLSIVMPCCNEEEALDLLPQKLFRVVEELQQQYDTELVCVDDGSTDATWEKLTALRDDYPAMHLVLARHQVNLGLGAALQTGQQHASGDVVVMMDADGTYPFTIIRPLVEAIEAGADVATASPYHPAGGIEGVSAFRLVFSRGASILYRVLVDPRIHTWTAMVRAYRSPVLADSLSVDYGFVNVAMTLVEARRRGARIEEIPAVLSSRTVGVSKAKIWKITRAHLRYMSSIALLRTTGRFWIVPDAQRVNVATHG